MEKALGILLIFAGLAGGYAVITGKLTNPLAPTTTTPSTGSTGAKQVKPAQSGDNKPVVTAKDLILPSQGTGGGPSWQGSQMGIPMLFTHTGDIAAAQGGM